MKIKHIQALELFLHTFYKEKELVFDYKNKLFTANFLSYYNDTPLTKNVGDEEKTLLHYSTSGFFASDAIMDLFREDQFNGLCLSINNKSYYLHEKPEIINIIKPLYEHIIEYDEKFKDNSVLDIVPTNIKFLDKNNSEMDLPFYLFDDKSEINLVSVKDK